MSILDQYGQPISAIIRRGEYMARSAFAGAETNRHREKTWEKALDHDADGDLLPELKTLRKRCRHEIRNNAYAAGIGQTRADYLIGDGPRLQFRTSSEEINSSLEKAFARWSRRADASGRLSFAGIMRLGEEQLWPCGEYFLIEIYGKNGLTYQLIEPDRICNPNGKMDSESLRDGIEYDPVTGLVSAYWIAKFHPHAYSGKTPMSASDWTRVPAERVIHRPNLVRPGQTRGQPLMASVLNPLSDLRRFRNATLLSAETAALFAAYMKTQGPMGEDDEALDYESVDIQPGTISTLAPGYDIAQIKPEHPANTHKDFMQSMLAECGRAACMPYNVVALDSSRHNYSSGRLDWQAFHRYLETERDNIERQVLQPVISAFLVFARLSGVALTPDITAEAEYDWEILWPGLEHVDPTKEANAAISLIEAKLQTYSDYFASQGFDYREKFQQIANEKEFMDSLGITPAEVNSFISSTSSQTSMEDAEHVVQSASA